MRTIKVIDMIRGQGLREFDTYFREPYITIINLFVRMENPKLTSREVRYILLKTPNLSRLKRFKSEQEKILEPTFTYNTKMSSLKRIRTEYTHRLVSKLPGSRFKYMTCNGLNLALRRMCKKILEHKHKRYSLLPEFYDYCLKRDPNSVLQKLSKRNLVLLRKRGYAIYYPGGDSLLKQVIENQQELATLIKKIQTVRLKSIIQQLLTKLKEDRELCGDWVLVGCILYQLTDQIQRIPYLDISDFTEELSQISALLKNDELRENAKHFSTGIKNTLTTFDKKLKLNGQQKSAIKLKHPWMLSKNIRVCDVVSGYEWELGNTKSVNELVELGIITKNDYVVYKNHYKSSLYLSQLGYEKYLKWSFLNNPPQIVMDFGY